MSEGRQRDLAVLIVSYRRADLLDRCLASVDKYLPDVRVLVWDNRSSGSDDVRALAAHHPRVDWTFSDTNVGYIEAMNRLAEQVPDCDLLTLNPDAELLGPLTASRAALAEPGVAAVSPTVDDPEGHEERWDVAHRDPTLLRTLVNHAGYAKRLRGRAPSDLYAATPVEVDGYLTGCCLFLSRAAWDALGPFDTRFFVYGEDATWQPAARKAGWRLLLVDEPEPQVRHASAGTTADDPLASRRGEDLLRASHVLALGFEANTGRGAVFSAAAAVLDRVQRSKRTERRRMLRAQAAQADGRPAVVITTNNLILGGAERQRVHLANELVARGHPVTFVCLQHLGQYVAELDPRVRLTLQPWWQPAVDVPGDHAVVITGITNTEVGFALGWRRLGRNRRWVAASHDSVEAGGKAYSPSLAAAVRRADAMVVLSRAHHEGLVAHQRLNPTALLAPNGISPAAPRVAVPSDRVRFGMLTRIIELKNPLMLIDALDALGRDDWELNIYGDGPDRSWLEPRTPPHLRDRVHWRGRSSGPDEAMPHVDVLCVPSRREAFPLTIVEAMMRSVPVLASAVGSIPEMLDHGRAGVLVEPNTREAWTAALAAVMDGRTDLAAVGEAGRRRALERYTSSAMADDYQRVIGHVLGEPVLDGPGGSATVL